MTESWEILEGDCLQVLRTLPADTFHACVTSPPYFALRDYKVSGQIGLEKSPEAFIGKLVEVFGEVRRVLRPDGVCWVNMGDSYAASGSSGPGSKQQTNEGANTKPNHRQPRTGYQQGDLMGIPWKLAMAMQADGWILRSAVVWRKPAPMPESVSGWRWQRCRVKMSPRKPANHKYAQHGIDGRNTGQNTNAWNGIGENATWTDCPGCKKCEKAGGLILRKGSWRPTRSHEFIFMLAKSPEYFADGECVRTKLAEATISRDQYSRILDDPDEQFAVRHDHETISNPGGANLRDVWQAALESMSKEELIGYIQSMQDGNLDDVQTIGPEPLSLGHYAAFPSELPRLCLKASTSEKGCCPHCGSQWARVLEISRSHESGSGKNGKLQGGGETGDIRNGPCVSTETLGWRPTCPCPPHEPIPPLILDPFAGAGTTILAARRMGLRAVGIELNPDYAAMARQRIREDNPLFNGVG